MNENLDPSSEPLSPIERDIEKVLRPQAFDDFTGQEKVMENLKIFVEAAKLRGEPWITCCYTALPDWVKLPFH